MIHFIFPGSKIRPQQNAHLRHPLRQHEFQWVQMVQIEQIKHNIWHVIRGKLAVEAFPSPTSGPGQHLKSAAALLRQCVLMYWIIASTAGKKVQRNFISQIKIQRAKTWTIFLKKLLDICFNRTPFSTRAMNIGKLGGSVDPRCEMESFRVVAKNRWYVKVISTVNRIAYISSNTTLFLIISNYA